MKELKLFQTAEFKLVDMYSLADVYKGTEGYSNDNNMIAGRSDEEEQGAQVVINNNLTPQPLQEAIPVTEIYIEGYASVFIDRNGQRLVDRDGESVNIDFLDIESYKDNAVLNFNHNFNEVVGKIVAIQKDSKGLYVKAIVYKLTGREHIFEAVQKGLIKAFSIGFVPAEFNYVEGDVLEVSRATLVEISLVGTQANQESLFRVVGQKSPTISKKMLAEQNNMTCSELDGSCMFKSQLKQKGVEMEEIVPVVQEKVEEPVVVIAEPAKVFDEEAMVTAITNAQIKADELKAERLAEVEAKAKADAEAVVAADLARIEDVKAYIKEQTDKFVNTPAEDLDTDTVADFYELISSSAEAIESKVASVIKDAA